MTTNEPDFLHFKKTLGLPFEFCGEYDIPCLRGIRIKDLDSIDMIGFNYATQKNIDKSLYIHFFLGDYKIEKFWKLPDRYLSILSKYRGIILPDFSLYTTMPKALQIYNYYRNMWLGAYAQYNGVKVIPSVTWSDESSFDWCFDGMPKRSCICVSTVGCYKNPAVRRKFMTGFENMVSRLEPYQLIVYGKPIPEMLSVYDGPVKVIKSDMKKRIQFWID